MKHPQIVVSIVIGLSLIVCAWLLQFAIVSYGKSLERAAQYQKNIDIPTRITLDVDVDPLDLRLGNAGGGRLCESKQNHKEGGEAQRQLRSPLPPGAGNEAFYVSHS